MGLLDLLMLWGLVIGCPAIVWLRSGGSGRPGSARPALSTRGRLRLTGWCLGLMVLGLAVMSTLGTFPEQNYGPDLVVLLIPAIAVMIRPRLVFGLVPPALIVLGLYGFTIVRDFAFWSWYGASYSFLLAGPYRLQFYLVLPMAYGLVLLGGWLAWRVTNHESPAARLVLGRLADTPRHGPPWALLLLPVTAMAGELLTPNEWFSGGVLGVAWSAAVLVGTFGVIRWSPGRAAGLAAVGLIVLGVIGLAIPGSWASWHLPLPPNHYVLYGIVAVSSRAVAILALVQAVALIGFGAWLAPRTIPQVRQLLGWAFNGELTKRVERLTESRAVAVDTAASELRRLERDLHDGAQARLVALGMTLSAAERLIPTSPEAAAILVNEARQTSARALTELRELVRGVHPPVLADRGLGDALRALALDTPMKIETDIDLPSRLAAPVETACYFAAAEVLTNAAKHSGAREGRLAARHADGVLRIEVTDFGIGGADPAHGSGLAGVERRLAAFDGIVAVSSPAGGPTMIVMEVPCASSLQKISSF